MKKLTHPVPHWNCTGPRSHCTSLQQWSRNSGTFLMSGLHVFRTDHRSKRWEHQMPGSDFLLANPQKTKWSISPCSAGGRGLSFTARVNICWNRMLNLRERAIGLAAHMDFSMHFAVCLMLIVKHLLRASMFSHSFSAPRNSHGSVQLCSDQTRWAELRHRRRHPQRCKNLWWMVRTCRVFRQR